MNYTLKDIKHLEVMAGLINKEPVSEPKINIKKLLASNEPKELTLGEKILTLCSKLRHEGFEKQADGLEQKFVSYKTASTHLYRAIDEDGEDLINAAHPDGEKKVEDAEGDLGVVETILTEHKKIVDKITKEPTGKLAFKHIIDKIAQNANELGTINLVEISKKFSYLADYLKRYFVTIMPEGDTIQPEARNYYGLLSAWQEWSNDAATELNKNELVSIIEAMKLVKNQFATAKFSNPKQYVQRINNVSDIDKFVSWILSWVEDNNPIKKNAIKRSSGKLASYVSDVKNVFFKQAFLPSAIAVWLWSKTNRFNQGVLKNTEILRSELQDLLGKEELPSRAAQRIRVIDENLSKLIEYATNYNNIAPVLEDKDLSTINDFNNFMVNTIKPNLNELHNMMVQFRKINESGTVSNIYRTFVASDFEDVQKAIAPLNKEITDLSAYFISVQTGMMENLVNKDESLVISKDKTDVKSLEIAKLNVWKNKLNSKQMDELKKQHIVKWIDGQIKELQSANTTEQVIKIIEENKRFEARGLI